MLKTAGIPWWATGFALIVFLLGCVLGLSAISGHSMEPNMTISWGGRTLGLGLAAALAVLLRSPAAYLAAFAGGLAREAGDLIGELSRPQPSPGVIAGIAVFLAVGALSTLAAYKAHKQPGGSRA